MRRAGPSGSAFFAPPPAFQLFALRIVLFSAALYPHGIAFHVATAFSGPHANGQPALRSARHPNQQRARNAFRKVASVPSTGNTVWVCHGYVVDHVDSAGVRRAKRSCKHGMTDHGRRERSDRASMRELSAIEYQKESQSGRSFIRLRPDEETALKKLASVILDVFGKGCPSFLGGILCLRCFIQQLSI